MIAWPAIKKSAVRQESGTEWSLDTVQGRTAFRTITKARKEPHKASLLLPDPRARDCDAESLRSLQAAAFTKRATQTPPLDVSTGRAGQDLQGLRSGGARDIRRASP